MHHDRPEIHRGGQEGGNHGGVIAVPHDLGERPVLLGESWYDETMLTDEQLKDMIVKALAALKANDEPAAVAIVMAIPRSQRRYVADSLAGAIEDKKAKA